MKEELEDKAKIQIENTELINENELLNIQLATTKLESVDLINKLKQQSEGLTKDNENLIKQIDILKKKYGNQKGNSKYLKSNLKEIESDCKNDELRKARKQIIDLSNLVERYEMNTNRLKELLITKEEEASLFKTQINKILSEQSNKYDSIIEENSLLKENLNGQIDKLKNELNMKDLLIEQLAKKNNFSNENKIENNQEINAFQDHPISFNHTSQDFFQSNINSFYNTQRIVKPLSLSILKNEDFQRKICRGCNKKFNNSDYFTHIKNVIIIKCLLMQSHSFCNGYKTFRNQNPAILEEKNTKELFKKASEIYIKIGNGMYFPSLSSHKE